MRVVRAFHVSLSGLCDEGDRGREHLDAPGWSVSSSCRRSVAFGWPGESVMNGRATSFLTAFECHCDRSPFEPVRRVAQPAPKAKAAVTVRPVDFAPPQIKKRVCPFQSHVKARPAFERPSLSASPKCDAEGMAELRGGLPARSRYHDGDPGSRSVDRQPQAWRARLRLFRTDEAPTAPSPCLTPALARLACLAFRFAASLRRCARPRRRARRPWC